METVNTMNVSLPSVQSILSTISKKPPRGRQAKGKWRPPLRPPILPLAENCSSFHDSKKAGTGKVDRVDRHQTKQSQQGQFHFRSEEEGKNVTSQCSAPRPGEHDVGKQEAYVFPSATLQARTPESPRLQRTQQSHPRKEREPPHTYFGSPYSVQPREGRNGERPPASSIGRGPQDQSPYLARGAFFPITPEQQLRHRQEPNDGRSQIVSRFPTDTQREASPSKPLGTLHRNDTRTMGNHQSDSQQHSQQYTPYYPFSPVSQEQQGRTECLGRVQVKPVLRSQPLQSVVDRSVLAPSQPYMSQNSGALQPNPPGFRRSLSDPDRLKVSQPLPFPIQMTPRGTGNFQPSR